MTKILELGSVQVGKETVRGTAVTPTAKLMGVTSCSIKPIERSELVEELRGSLAPGFNAIHLEAGGEASLEGVLTYEDVCYMLDGLFSAATPAGAGPYTRSYSAPLTSPPSPDARTLIYGDGDAAYRLAGALVSELSFSIESKAASTFSASLIGTRVTDGSLAALSDRTVTPILPHHWSLYIDAWDGTIGTTLISSTAFSASLTITPERANVHHLSLTPDGWRDRRWSGELELVLELTSGVETFMTSVLGSSPLQKQIRLQAVSGTNSLQVDFAGAVLEAPELFSDSDGVTTVSLTFTGQYNPVLANWLTIESVNGVASLP